MRITLPPSLQKERHTLEEEVSWAKTLTPEERLAVVAMLCRDTVALLQMNPKAAQVLEMRDPLPESSRRALARLHREL